MKNLTLQKRFMIGPFLGLILIVILTASYLFQTSRQNDLFRNIAHQDLEILSHYTSLFIQLSKNHIELFELLNEAGKNVNEGDVYDRGTLILDNIYTVTKELEEISNINNKKLNIQSFDKESLALFSQHVSEYRNNCISAVEMVTVALDLAPLYLSKADKNFLFIHESFSKNLNTARKEIKNELEKNININRTRNYRIAILGLLLAVGITVLGYFLSLLLSQQLQKQINKLKRISKSHFDINASDKEEELTDEVSKIDQGIELFEHTIKSIREKDEELSAANILLQSEIEERKTTEIKLLEFQQELEQRVESRTLSLSEANESLKTEISHRDIIEKELQVFKKMFDSTEEAVLICDAETNIININPAFINRYGYSAEEVVGKKPDIFNSGNHNEMFYENVWEELNEQGYWNGEIWDKRKNGEIFPQWATINNIRDSAGNITQYIALYRDISEMKEAEQRLQEMAFYDALTGLPNRLLFNERLHHEISSAKRHQTKLAVLFIDLDRFKYVNDTMGHSIGDVLLMEVGTRITNALRKNDTVSRLGGDEFTVIASGIEDDAAAVKAAIKIIDALQKPIKIGVQEIQVGASIGIAIFEKHGSDAETLKVHADIAMYKAKADGRNRYCMFDEQLKHDNNQHLSLLSDLEKALENNEFSLNYQPIIDLQTNKIISAEALIRWTKKDGTTVSPVHFIPLAEESGVIDSIDQWVLETACEEAFLWQEINGSPLQVNVNLSSSFFQNKENLLLLSKTFSNTGLLPEQLCLEITETAVIANPQLAKVNLHAITEMGISIALDDFGTGFSSLNHLLHFPISRIKIDRSFIQNVDTDVTNEAIVRSLIELSNNLDISVVAEGVETVKHHDYLRDLQCGYGQGYFYSRPIVFSEFRELLRSKPKLEVVEKKISSVR